MECGLQWKDITCWEDASRLTLTHEETLETAIADYCPDMGRVVETAGQLCLRSIVPQGGRGGAAGAPYRSRCSTPRRRASVCAA